MQSPSSPKADLTVASADGSDHARNLARVERVARWMDGRHLDPMLGFVVPGLGDAVGAVLGLYTVYLAYRMGYSRIIVARMMINLSVDTFVGVLPIVGDVFDIFHKAHIRNLALLRAAPPDKSARPSDWLIVLGAAFLFLAAIASCLTVLLLLLRAVF